MYNVDTHKIRIVLTAWLVSTPPVRCAACLVLLVAHTASLSSGTSRSAPVTPLRVQPTRRTAALDLDLQALLGLHKGLAVVVLVYLLEYTRYFVVVIE